MISSALWLVRYMVESPAQSGRLGTFIHPRAVSGRYVRMIEVVGGNVADTLAKTIFLINGQGLVVVDQPGLINWFVVIQNRIAGA